MSRPHHPPALQLQFTSPFGFEVVRFGLLGVHANAFLHGVFDDVDRGCSWSDHGVLRQAFQVRRESDLALEADWLGEWLALMRDEGATSLRVHFEDYRPVQQHFVLDLREHDTPPGPRGVVFSACVPGLFGERCIASWTPILEESLARRRLRGRSLAFHVPVGIPANCVMPTMVRTAKKLSGARVPTIDVHAVVRQLDQAFALGKQAGYVMADFPDAHSARIDYLRDHPPQGADLGAGGAMPAFFNDPMADVTRDVFVDAGVLAGQLAQVPERVPAHPYDDFNQGPIYPPTDPDGKVYRQIDSTVHATGTAWFWLCFQPLTRTATTDPLVRLRLRTPWDIGFGDEFVAPFGLGVVRGDD